MSINGQTIGGIALPALNPGQRATITIPYVPTQPGSAQIVARLTFADQNPDNKYTVRSAQIAPQRAVVGTVAGTLRALPNGGGYGLDDARGRHVATVVVGKFKGDLASYRDVPVVATGRLVSAVTGFRFEVDDLARSAAATPRIETSGPGAVR